MKVLIVNGSSHVNGTTMQASTRSTKGIPAKPM